MRELNKARWPGRARITMVPGVHDNIDLWLRQNVGGWDSYRVVGRGDHVRDYYFRSESEATLFALRWM